MIYKIGTVSPIDLPFIQATSTNGLKQGLIELGMSRKGAAALLKDFTPNNASGYCGLITDAGGAVVCGAMVAKKRDYNTIAHESTHLAVMALDWAGIEYDADNHEILAYYVGWFVAEHLKPWRQPNE